ncbi:MAG: hypothetical protein GY716_00565 [bacterium]|nr:hypothetical protein [bacterium]
MQRRAIRTGLKTALILCVAGLAPILAGTTPERLCLPASGGHSPVADGDLGDWCVGSAPRAENRAALLQCDAGGELVWWDAPADGAVNDLATIVATHDADNLYWGFNLHNDADPVLMPFIEIAIDVAPGGNPTWWDPQSALTAPGRCSVSTDRRCTADADCHFCSNSTVYTGTPLERPRVCGSTGQFDECDYLDPTDICNREEVCEELDVQPAVPGAGSFSSPESAPDYLLVFDLGRWLIGICDSIMLLRADGPDWVEIPRQTPDLVCNLPTWRFAPQVNPGTGGGGGGPPSDVEFEIPWEAFDCPECATFEPGTCFTWTTLVSRTLLTLDYSPDLGVEDVMSEAVSGTSTSTTDSCAAGGAGSTLCEIADGSTDAFAPFASGVRGGRVSGLRMAHNPAAESTPSLTLEWDPSCAAGDDDYAVYAGDLGVWDSHAPRSGLCSTAGATTVTFDPDAGSRFYLIVPADGATEGSYGVDGLETERPQSAVPCLAQSLGTCP